MSTVHFLNVKEGDCSILQHNSDHVTVIDVCNAKAMIYVAQELGWTNTLLKRTAQVMAASGGNFNQKAYPVNPIEYMGERGIDNVFRYVQTHPDMDHMDGIKPFFEHFGPLNFWDTNNKKELTSWDGSPYNSSDWKFYKNLRDSNPSEDPRRLTLLSGATGMYWNTGEGNGNGDGINILAPTKELVQNANESDGDYNDCSYVLLYRTGKMKVIFAGDSHDATWEHILANHSDKVRNVDLLIAPHHGRKSDRDYGFLDELKPSLTLFGNAPSQYLAYGAWNNRGLEFVTNNQADCIVVDIREDYQDLYVTNESFARQRNPNTFFDDKLKAWAVERINSRA